MADAPDFDPASPKLQEGFALSGGRHYRRAGLGAFGTWTCPECATEQHGPLTQGCAACPAGRPPTAPAQKVPAMPPMSNAAPPNPYAPRRATSPLLAQAAPAPGAMKREELLRELRQIVRDELANVFAPPTGQLTVSPLDAYALRTGLELLEVAMSNSEQADPHLPTPERLQALAGELYLIEDPAAVAVAAAGDAVPSAPLEP